MFFFIIFFYYYVIQVYSQGYYCLCVLADPGKYNFTPRLFRLSASGGTFQEEEQFGPAQVTGTIMAMPFLQENLYSAPQPGT